MSGPTITRGRTIGPHQTALRVDQTPDGRTEQSPRPGLRFSPRRIPFVSRLLRRWGKGRDERSQSRPPPPSEQPPIPSALAPAMDAGSSPLPALSMLVLSIVRSILLVHTRSSSNCRLYLVNFSLQMCHRHSYSSWLRVSLDPSQIKSPNSRTQVSASTKEKLTLDFGPVSSVCRSVLSTPATLSQLVASSFFLTQFVTSLLWVSLSVIRPFMPFLSIRRQQ